MKTGLTVASERAAGTVGAVGTWSQPQDEYSSFFITEGRHRLRPINPIAISATLAGGYLLAILAQTGAPLAADHVLVEQHERTGRGKARISCGQTGTCDGRARAYGRTCIRSRDGAHTRL